MLLSVKATFLHIRHFRTLWFSESLSLKTRLWLDTTFSKEGDEVEANVLRLGGDWAHYDAHGRNPHAIAAQDNVLLSKSPMPEFWCSILYFELDTQVSPPDDVTHTILL